MGKQYLTFKLADTVYAVNVFQVREVLSYTPPQQLPRSDPIIEGLIRSRDQSIPVVNLRRKFALADKQPDAASRIIVVEVNNYEEGSVSVFGAVADSVNEVLDLDTIGFEDTPELGNSPASAFVDGIGRQGDAFIIILDVDKIFSFDELSEMNELDNRTVAPEYAQYTQELPPQRHEPPKPKATQAPIPAATTPAAKESPRIAPEKVPPAESKAPMQALGAAPVAPSMNIAHSSPQEAGIKQVLPAIKTPPVSVQSIKEEPLQKAEAEKPVTETEEPAQVEDNASPASQPTTRSASFEQNEEIAQREPQADDLQSLAAEAEKEIDQAGGLDGRYDALDFAPEDFELL